jgi:hypothetical protein
LCGENLLQVTYFLQIPAYIRWLNVGLPNLVEDESILRDIREQEESCEILEEKMGMLRKALGVKKEQGGHSFSTLNVCLCGVSEFVFCHRCVLIAIA